MVIKAATDDGRDVRLEISKILQWVMGIAATLVTASVIGGTAKIIQLDLRVTSIEASRFTAEDFQAASAELVTVREYDARTQTIAEQLRRIEDKLDRVIER